ncbi:MAG: SusC/RagA family TonB-linked outer membrane protein [Candidatus Cryptobacteroides sp.]
MSFALLTEQPARAFIPEPSVAAQPSKVVVTGRVTDRQGEPVPGVTVYVKGNTAKGTMTDEKGRYNLDITSESSKKPVIIFSCIGMDTQEITFNGKTVIDVVMDESASELENSVVTGYANIRKESFTGNTVSVSKEELLKASKTNVIKALQSFDPSFRIKENNLNGSDPNAVPELYIRGESGVGTKELDVDEFSKANLENNPNLPIFILDGFEITAQKLYDMDPDRIENITILKDAAATALYGSRASNGVVVITSVAPSPGKLKISYKFVGTVEAPDLSDYNLMNAEEKLQTELLAGCYDPVKAGVPSDVVERLTEYNAKLQNVRKGVDTYWMAKPLRSVFNHKHSLYIDGGSSAFRFGVDLQYTNQDGVMKGSKRDRMGAGVYLQYVYKQLSIKNYTSFLQTDSRESPYGSFSDYTKAQPYDEYLDEYGNYLETLRSWSIYSGSVRANPLYEAGLDSYQKSRSQEFINNLSINWYIIDGLRLSGQVSVTKGISSSDRFYDPRSKKNSQILDLSNPSSGTLYTTSGDRLSWNVNAYLSYNKSFGNHNINGQAGVNVIDSSSESINTTYFGFPSGKFDSINYAQELNGKPTSSESTSRTIGFLAGVNYSYKDIYLLDASCRFDGNSAFGKDNRFAPFWAAGAGLNIHNYAFFKSTPLTLLRLRVTYGRTGKINFPAYAALTTYQVNTEEWYKTGYGVTIMSLGNRNLRWEITDQLDTGFELGLWKNRIYAKFSYYSKLTKDLINDVTIPSSTGFTSFRDNIGEVTNKGVELNMRVEAIRTSDMILTLQGSLAHNKNRLRKVAESLEEYNKRVQDTMASYGNKDENAAKPFTQYVEGVSLNSIWGMKSLGIDPATGQEIYLTKDGKLTDTWTASEQQVLGETDPKVQGYFGFNFQWKNFTVYTSFLYEAGGYRYNQTLATKVEGVSIYQSNVDRRVLTDRWTTPGQVASFKAMEPGIYGVTSTRPTSRFVQKYNALSFSSLTIGYSIDRKYLKKAHMNMLRIELGTNDLFHVSSVKQERGLSYPYSRSFNLSVQIGF